jgi:acetyl esterase/lipase
MYMESFIHIIEHLKAKGIEARIFSIEYRRNPEVDYHQTKEDCMDAYRYLIHDLNINSNKIVFGKCVFLYI